jgi:aryl-alcohol dehydrogenase-like predicted oxidoreductase
MRYRALDKTGLEVSRLGLRAWGIGGTMWIGADGDESLRALRRAIEHGVKFLDTAYGYGDGHSEQLVGAACAIRPRRSASPARPRRRTCERDGQIRFFGVSINDHQPENAIRLVESGLVDAVQVIYNVFDQSPEDALFPAVETARVGVIVRVPLDEGALTGSVRPGSAATERIIAPTRPGTMAARRVPFP